MRTLLLLAATVRSFAHMPLEISDRNTVIDEIRKATIIESSKAE